MSNKDVPTPPSTLQVQDIYFILFRHKWKILLFTLLGIATAAALFFVHKPPYQSVAKLAIRYVMEDRPLDATTSGHTIESPDSRGSNIINTEMEILSSWDLAYEVAMGLGPDKILPEDGEAANPYAAARAIVSGLTLEAPKNSNIVKITFAHSNPAITQEVLSRLIDLYLEKHAEIHRSKGTIDEFLTKETDQLRSRIRSAEDELTKLKSEAGVISMDEKAKALAAEESSIRMQLNSAKARLAALQARANYDSPNAAQTIEVESAAEPPLSEDLVADYNRLVDRLDQYRKREGDLLLQFTEKSPLVQSVVRQIQDVENKKSEMEKEHPRLVYVQPKTNGKGAASLEQEDPMLEIESLQATIKVLESQLADLQSERLAMNKLETSIADLDRQKTLDEEQYHYFKTSLEQTRISQALDSGEISNISRVQKPSPPARNNTKLEKMMALAVVAGLCLGIGLAFLIEFYLDLTIKRVSDLERKLRLPVYLSIPYLNGDRGLFLEEGGDAGPGGKRPLAKRKRSKLEPWDSRHRLRVYYEALRDRVVMYFEHITHKPKLLGITSCAPGSGVTSIASGLAATLSETGDGRVLLVDMKLKENGVHPFFQGKPGHGPADVFEDEKKETAYVNENLYLATAGKVNGSKPRAMPRRLTELMPKLKASDYDYIIFDMPPINATSITPRIAASMDQMILVVESEKIQADVVKRAKSMLEGYNAKVVGVLNKTRSYVPRGLSQEII